MKSNKWIIKDWTGQIMFNEIEFNSFDDAEEYLTEFLGDNYETDRQEYYIFQKRKINYE